VERRAWHTTHTPKSGSDGHLELQDPPIGQFATLTDRHCAHQHPLPVHGELQFCRSGRWFSQTCADLPEAKGPAEATGKYEDTVFEIDAQLAVPPHGYGLTAVRRFLIAFGRRRHTNSVPLAVLFGRAVSSSAATPPSECRGI
jgi:hypothetical protein